ncbi:MAG: DUF3467 domain-containing protein [Planctomycetia bacterium]
MDGEYHDADRPLERVQPASLAARVPEGVVAGVFATGAIVLQSPTEVMIDFVQGLASPRRIAVRVVMPPGVAVQFAEALGANLGTYESTFGRVPSEPRPAAAEDTSAAPAERVPGGGRPESVAPAAANQPQQPIADAYDQLKASDEVLGGAYANTVLIAHTGSEFHLDFINRCFPRSIVNARVYMAAPRASALLESLKRSLRLG